MSLKIRLSRGGSKKDPHYQIVVIPSTKKRDGKFIEKLGHYHPRNPKGSNDRIVIEKDRFNHWMGVGAIPTEVVIKLAEILNISIPDKYKKPIVDSKFKGMSKKQISEHKKAQKKLLEEAKIAKEKKQKELEAKQT